MAAPAAEGRRLLRVEARNAAVGIEDKPDWIKTRYREGPEFTQVRDLVREHGLHTVCQEAGCPNVYECWEDREATFLIGGDQCTRRCDFCQIDTGRPEPLDRDEPRRVAESVATLGLRYATVTGVARDDLPDGGAWLYAEVVRQIHQRPPRVRGRAADPRLPRRPRPARRGLRQPPRGARAQRGDRPARLPPRPPGLRLPPQRSTSSPPPPRPASSPRATSSSGWARRPTRSTRRWPTCATPRCDVVTITQYLRPSPRHHPVERWVRPEEFVALAQVARDLGFPGVLSGPLVRSSYRAGRLHAEALAARSSTSAPRVDTPA